MKKLKYLLPLLAIFLMGQKGVDPVPTVEALDVAKAQYTNIGGKLYVYTGKTATVKQYDSVAAKQIDVAVPKADTVQVEASTDSTEIVWVNTAQYVVKAKRELKDGYHGTFDARMGKAFWVGKKEMSVIDYERGTYTVPGPIKAGYEIDPGYAAAPLWVGPSPKYAVGDSTRPLPDTSGDQIVFWFTGDSVKAGKFLNLIGNDTGVATAGSFEVASGIVGSCLYNGGSDSVVWPAASKYNILGQVTIMSWLKPLTSAEDGNYISNGTTAANTGYVCAWLGSGNKLQIYGLNATTASATVFVDSVWTRTTFCNSDSARFYRNGVHAGGLTTKTFTAGNLNFLLGNKNGGTTSAHIFNGWIDRTIIADTAINRLRRNTYMVSKRELPTNIRDSTSGIVWIDTAGNSCDSVTAWNATVANYSIRLPVVAGNLYNITGAFTLDSTRSDTATDTVVIAQGKQLKHRHDINSHSRDTLNFGGINNVGQGDTTQYVIDFSKTIDNEYYGYDTLYTPVITSIAPAVVPVAGGTSDSIVGTYFYATIESLTVGSARVCPTSWADTKIKFTTPAQTAGSKNVIVTNVYGLADTVALVYFRYDTSRCCTTNITSCLSSDTNRVIRKYVRYIDSVAATTVRIHTDSLVIDTTKTPPTIDTLVTGGGDSVQLTISACPPGYDTTARDTFYVYVAPTSTDNNKGPYKQRPYKSKVYKIDPYKQPAYKRGNGW